VRTDRDDTFRAKYLVTATGILHKPKLPGTEGMTTFRGHSFHTSRWDYGVTGGRDTGELTGLQDKRVAIIGTGATSIQVVPAAAKWSKHFYVFQRTPSSVNVRNNHPTKPDFASSLKPGWQRARMENFNAILAGLPVDEDLVNDGWTDMKILSILGSENKEKPENSLDIAEKMQLADYRKMESIRARVDAIVRDKETAEKLKPWYASMCKRPCFHDEYLQTFNRPNCTLVDTDGKGVERITEKGIVANGKEYEVDVIIYSTGFVSPATAWQQSGIDIKGRGGLLLSEKWADGVSTLFGAQTREFPNYFIVSVSQAGATANFLYTLDHVSKHIAYVISECERQRAKTVEPTVRAEDNWVKSIVEGGKGMRSYFANCTPSYYSNEGAIEEIPEKNGSYGGGASAWAQVLEKWRERGCMEGLEVRKNTNSGRL
jgi:cyclohexanone monooxygenase